jgi:hypothetical protein
MDIGKAFSFVFEDKEWIQKIAIAAVILLVGIALSWLLLIPLILAFALLAGYTVEIIRRVLRGEAEVLPKWGNWGVLLTDGLKALVIYLVYFLPMIILSLCLGIPIGALGERSPEASSVFSAFLSCISFIYAIAVTLVLPAATAKFAATNDLGAAFRFGEVFGLVRNNLSIYLITLVMAWVASLIGGLGALVCGVGWLVTYPYAWMVTGHLYGQAHLEATGQGLPPAPAPQAPVLEEPV